MTRRCRDCGVPFEPARPYHRSCWDCWREQQDSRQRDATYDRGWHDGYVAANRAYALRAAPPLDGELIASAISLTHPDRHPVERSELANRTTARLLELRGELAA